MSWWTDLLKQIVTKVGLAVADAGTDRLTDTIGPKGTGKKSKTPT